MFQNNLKIALRSLRKNKAYTFINVAGLAIGAARPEVKIPDVIKMLGLAIFVYSIGMSSGPAFFRSMKSRGAANLILAVLSLSILSICVGLSAIFFGFDSSGAAGLLAGITTNTPALAGLLDAIQARGGPDVEAMSNSAVVAASPPGTPFVYAAAETLGVLPTFTSAAAKASGESGGTSGVARV